MRSRLRVIDLAVEQQIFTKESTYIPRNLLNNLRSNYRNTILTPFADRNTSFKTWFPKLKEDLDAISS